MRQDIKEAYTRVMGKAWQPSKEQGVKLKPLTAGRASVLQGNAQAVDRGARDIQP